MEIQKVYFTMSEVAEMLSMSQSNIRYWMTYFELETKRKWNNQRRFTQADVDKLKAIKVYQLSGYHLWAIKGLLKK